MDSSKDGIKEMRGASKCGYGDMYTIDYAMFPVQESCVYLCLAHCHSVRFTKPLPVHLLLNIKFPMNIIYEYSVIII